MAAFFFESFLEAPWEHLAWVLLVVFSICVHEYAHAAAALRCGDDTAARAGHLTLNPLRQMGLFSLVMLLVAGLAWGAVPVDTRALARRSDAARVAFAGPGSNLLLAAAFALLCGAVLAFAGEAEAAAPLLVFLKLAAYINATLFLLNLLPVPILDGWAILTVFVPALDGLRRRMGPMVGLLLFALLVGTRAIDLVWAGGAALSGGMTRAASGLFALAAR